MKTKVSTGYERPAVLCEDGKQHLILSLVGCYHHLPQVAIIIQFP